MDGEDSINQMAMIDSAYEKAAFRQTYQFLSVGNEGLVISCTDRSKIEDFESQVLQVC